ncbi:MAG: hypothetical protein DSZ33_02660, partial [Gammaproteobacteria bacterium]
NLVENIGFVGKDPRQPALHFERMYRDNQWTTGTVAVSAISALDIAMWDIKGQEVGKPVYELFGGPTFDGRVPVYCHVPAGATREEFADNISSALDRGYRVMKTWKNERSRAGAVIAVFMERLTGIAALLILGFIGGVIGWWLDGDWLSRWIVIFGLAGGAVTLIAGIVLAKTGAIYKLLQSPRCPGVVRTTFEHLADYRAKPGESAEVMAVSFGFHFLTIAWWWLLIAAVGAHLPLYHLVVVLAILSIVTILPLSINGIGLVDGSFIYLAGLYGVEYEQGLTIMLLLRALMIPISLIGAWYYLREKKDQHVRD